jgi:hypothetical protein
VTDQSRRIHPEALRGIADAADRLHAVIQAPRVDDHGVTVACLWTGTGPDATVAGFVAATPQGAVALGADVVTVAREARGMLPAPV